MHKKNRILLVLLLSFLAIPETVFAQLNTSFGKNRVIWEPIRRAFYSSEHFDIYHSLDVLDPDQRFYLENVANELEHSYDWLSLKLGYGLKKKVPAIIYKSHNEFETSLVAGDPFIPEGVGAYAEPSRNRMVIKLDFYLPLNRTIMTHELTHIFFFEIARRRFRAINPLPLFFVEGVMADYLASTYSPYGRDDIRKIVQRMIASNTAMYLPTWEMMESGQCGLIKECNPYIVGAMVSEFLRDTFGEKAVVDFIVRGSKIKNAASENPDKVSDLFKLLIEIGDGKIGSKKKFHELHMEYWSQRYARDMIDKAKPFQETDNFKGRSISPIKIPYPVLSPSLSPDGNSISLVTINRGKPVIISFPIGEEGQKPDGEYASPKKDEKGFSILTEYAPPSPYEYVVAQQLVTFPFNGSDQDWSRKNNRIAYFARKNRDHELVIINSLTGDILDEIGLSLDQAFSPVWGPDGRKIYFSASKNVTRDIYVIDLETKKVTNLTHDRSFDTAPTPSSDGTKIIYVGMVADFQKLFILDLATGEKKQLTFGDYNDNSPSFSEDDTRIVYTSDNNPSKVWNLYTLDLETGVACQWTDFFGGVFTPKFAKGKNNTIYYVAYWQYDQYKGQVYANFKLYEADLKKPIKWWHIAEHEIKTEPVSSSSLLIENQPKIDFGSSQISNQGLSYISNSLKQPSKWDISSGNFEFSYSNGFIYIGAGIKISDILDNRTHYLTYTSFGKLIQMANYLYVNAQNRVSWGFGAHYYNLDMRGLFWDTTTGFASGQNLLNRTDTVQVEADALIGYPFNKFNRVEGKLGIRHRSFDNPLGLTRDNIDELMPKGSFSNDDLQMARIFEDSNGNSASFAAAFVRDTVSYNATVQGPARGDAIKIQGEFAPQVGNLLGYSTFKLNSRKYFGINGNGSVVVALRGDVVVSTSKSGEFIVMGGSQSLRGYKYGMLVGNQIGYASAELRFPFINEIRFPDNVVLGPFRGVLFADAGYAKFRDESFPAKTGLSLGTMIQLYPFALSISWTDADHFRRKKVEAMLGLNW